jgi:hypothetical protein
MEQSINSIKEAMDKTRLNNNDNLVKAVKLSEEDKNCMGAILAAAHRIESKRLTKTYIIRAKPHSTRDLKAEVGEVNNFYLCTLGTGLDA